MKLENIKELFKKKKDPFQKKKEKEKEKKTEQVSWLGGWRQSNGRNDNDKSTVRIR